MKAIDYTLIENQFGCGWCEHEDSCTIHKEWMKLDKRERLLMKHPSLTCGRFVHFIESSKNKYRVSSDDVLTFFRGDHWIYADSAKEAAQLFATMYWPPDMLYIFVTVDDGCKYRVTRECTYNAEPV